MSTQFRPGDTLDHSKGVHGSEHSWHGMHKSTTWEEARTGPPCTAAARHGRAPRGRLRLTNLIMGKNGREYTHKLSMNTRSSRALQDGMEQTKIINSQLIQPGLGRLGNPDHSRISRSLRRPGGITESLVASRPRDHSRFPGKNSKQLFVRVS